MFQIRWWKNRLELDFITALFCLLTGLTFACDFRGGPENNRNRFDSSDRDAWQMPDSVVESLGLKPGDRVADIGAADGYFSLRFSRAVGESGRVHAVDLDLAALGRLARKSMQHGLSNIDTVHALPDDPRLPEKVDLAFFCNTLHHIHQRVQYLKDLKQGLDDGARLAVVEFFDKPLPVGPRGAGHKISRETTLVTLRESGFRVVEEFTFLPYQYFLVAVPE